MKKTFISEQAKEFRTQYNLKSSQTKGKRSYQKNLIVEEFKEFLEAEGMLFRENIVFESEALKELADLVYVCYQYAENMGWFLDEVFTVSKDDGAKWHLFQALAGDQTDGYSGVPGIGVKRATTLFDESGYSWKTVLKAFTDKGLTEYDAITNARLARILTVDDYDFKNKRPILWTPTADYQVNN